MFSDRQIILPKLSAQLNHPSTANPQLQYFLFFGEAQQLQVKLDALSFQQRSSIKMASIIIAGKVVNQGSQCCTCLTWLFGCLLCLPFLFMLCQWWKKITYNSTQVSLETYQSLRTILNCQSLSELTFVVQDNALGSQKAETLNRLISQSNLKKVKIFNIAGEFSLQGEACYDDFEENFKQLKSIPELKSMVRWSSLIDAKDLV